MAPRDNEPKGSGESSEWGLLLAGSKRKSESGLDRVNSNAAIVKALREWFARRSVPYEEMDEDTAWLWRVLMGV